VAAEPEAVKEGRVSVVVGIRHPLHRVVEVVKLPDGEGCETHPDQRLQGRDRHAGARGPDVRRGAQERPDERFKRAGEVFVVTRPAVVALVPGEHRVVPEHNGERRVTPFERDGGGGPLAEPATPRAGPRRLAEPDRRGVGGGRPEAVSDGPAVVQAERQVALGGDPVVLVLAVPVAPALPTEVRGQGDLLRVWVHPGPSLLGNRGRSRRVGSAPSPDQV